MTVFLTAAPGGESARRLALLTAGAGTLEACRA
jgi:hypothetical protein